LIFKLSEQINSLILQYRAYGGNGYISVKLLFRLEEPHPLCANWVRQAIKIRAFFEMMRESGAK